MPKEYSALQQEELKKRLMKSIIAVIKEKGYVHADVETIAKGAGISKSYLYKLYESKEDLLIKALSQHQYENVTRLRYLITHTEEDIEVSMRIFLKEIVSKGTYVDNDIVTESIYADLPEEIVAKFFSNLSYQYEAMIKILGLEHTGIDSKVFGNLFIALFIMLDMNRHKLYFYKDAIQATFNEIIETIISYIKQYLNTCP